MSKSTAEFPLVLLPKMHPQPEGGTEPRPILARDHALRGGCLRGLDGRIVEVQARALCFLETPAPVTSVTKIAGMPSHVAKESLHRIAGAFAKFRTPNSNVQVLVNIVPAEPPITGTWLDLPLAIIMLQAAGFLPELPDDEKQIYVLTGEVDLHGELRGVRGASSIAYAVSPGQELIVPTGNQQECVRGKRAHATRVHAVSTLAEVVEHFFDGRALVSAPETDDPSEDAFEPAVEFGMIRGQQRAKQAAVIAAAGGHNLLVIGPPGEGKSMIANAMAGILPGLANAEKAELTKIYSACDKLPREGAVVSRRPFRAVHPTTTTPALVGGGRVPGPGEITLAHLGVLFLDEIAEFRPATLDALRQPLDTGKVNISRYGATVEFPCRCTLVAAMNPCRCGFDGFGTCKCSEADISRYQKRLSGPLLDRIDLQVEVKPLTAEDRFTHAIPSQSAAFLADVTAARQRQRARFAGQIPFNAAIPGGQVQKWCGFSAGGSEAYRAVVEATRLSTRSTERLAKVARTVADLADSPSIEPEHVTTAAGFVISAALR